MKTTRKEIYRIYGKESVISLGYDIYELPEPYNDIVVCTGYAPFGTSSEKTRKVCERWEKLYYNYDYTQRKRMVKRFARELHKAINDK